MFLYVTWKSKEVENREAKRGEIQKRGKGSVFVPRRLSLSITVLDRTLSPLITLIALYSTLVLALVWFKISCCRHACD